MATNNNRKIHLYLSEGTRRGDTSWKHNFSRILGYQTERGKSLTQLFSTFDTSSMDAKESIDLLMLSAPKTPATNNAVSKPVETLLDTLNNTKVIGAISSVAQLGANVISVYKDAGDTDTNRTARIFQPWAKNVKSWSSSQGGITFEYEFKFSLGQYGLWNAKEEVVKPILNLVAPAFPQYLSDRSMAGPFPSTAELLYKMIVKDTGSNAANAVSDIGKSFSNIGSSNTDEMSTISKIKNIGSDIASAVDNSLNIIGDFLSTVVKSSFKQFTYTLEFGEIIQFKHMIIIQAKTSFSNEVDQNGFPVSGSATLTFEGLVPQALTYDTNNFGTIKMFGYGED